MFHQRVPMTYPPTTRGPLPPKPYRPPTHTPPPGYQVPVVDAPSRFSVRTLIVILISLGATAISAYRIRDAFQQDKPTPSPFQDFQKQNPEYAELITSMRERDYDKVDQALTKWPWLVNYSRPEVFGSPLLLAALTNQPDVIDLLIDRGADIKARYRWGGTALHWAAWRGSADAVEALLHRGADPNALSTDDASTPLFWAARGAREGFWSRNNHPAVVQKLLAAGASPDVCNSDGYYAVSVTTEEIASLLLSKGATPHDPATQPTFGKSTDDAPRFGFGWGFRRPPESNR